MIAAIKIIRRIKKFATTWRLKKSHIQYAGGGSGKILHEQQTSLCSASNGN